MIYADKKSPTNAPLIIGALLLFVIGALLAFCPNIFKHIKEKHLICGIASLAFIIAFLVFEVIIIFLIPKQCDLSQEVDRLHEIYFDMSRDDPEYETVHDEWYEAFCARSDLSFKIKMLLGGGNIALALATICTNNHKKENTESSEQNENNNAQQN